MRLAPLVNGSTTGLRIRLLTHHDSARWTLDRLDFGSCSVKPTANVTSIQYRLRLVLYQEHYRAGTMIGLTFLAVEGKQDSGEYI